MEGLKRPWPVAALLVSILAGCGAQYRPVVTPITPTGPASQPSAYFVAISSPSPTSAGLVTLVNAFGDTVLAQATLANGPFAFNLNASGSNGYNLSTNAVPLAGHSSGQTGSFTLNSYGISSSGSLKTQNVSTSTLIQGDFPFNTISATSALYMIEPYVDPLNGFASTGTPAVAQLTGSVPTLQQEIPVAPNPVNFAGTSSAPRIYAISQGSSTGGALSTPNACATPSSVTTDGEADAIEVSTNTVSNRLALGICPVFGLMSQDNLRAYILNRGSGTVTVINSQTNALDGATPSIAVGSGPVAADFYAPSYLLVTANYDSNSVSVVNVPTDQYGNDGATFGTHGCPSGATGNCTIAVGSGPIAVTILRDGSRAYVANQNDCTVSVVSLSSFLVTKTIPLGVTNALGQACHPKAIASVSSTPTGKVYVASADSNVLVAISTETDTVSASVQLPGNAVALYSTTQNAATATNSIVNSNAAGLGIPCAPGSTAGTSSDPSPFCVQ